VGHELVGKKLPSLACCRYSFEFDEERVVFHFIADDSFDLFWLKIGEHELVCEHFF